MSKNEAIRKRNQLNSQHSTGPKTEYGKKVSAINAYKRGIYSVKNFCLNEEEERKYKNLRNSFIQDFNISSGIETTLIEELTIVIIKKERMYKYEKEVLESSVKNQITSLNTHLLQLSIDLRIKVREKELIALKYYIKEINQFLLITPAFEMQPNEVLLESVKVVEMLDTFSHVYSNIYNLEKIEEENELVVDSKQNQEENDEISSLIQTVLNETNVLRKVIEDYDINKIKCQLGKMLNVLNKRMEKIEDIIINFSKILNIYELMKEKVVIDQNSIPDSRTFEYLTAQERYLDNKFNKLLENLLKLKGFFNQNN